MERRREAAFLADLGAVFFGYHRIDIHTGFIAGITDVQHQDANVSIDLGCGKPYSARFIHGLKHVIDQLREFTIEEFDRLGDGSQPLVRKF